MVNSWLRLVENRHSLRNMLIYYWLRLVVIRHLLRNMSMLIYSWLRYLSYMSPMSSYWMTPCPCGTILNFSFNWLRNNFFKESGWLKNSWWLRTMEYSRYNSMKKSCYMKDWSRSENSFCYFFKPSPKFSLFFSFTNSSLNLTFYSTCFSYRF